LQTLVASSIGSPQKLQFLFTLPPMVGGRISQPGGTGNRR
jgi:hypothetical protein